MIRDILKYLLPLLLVVVVFGAARHLDNAPGAPVPESQTQTVMQTESVPESRPEPSETAPTVPPETQPQETRPREEVFTLTFAGDCTLGSNPNNYYAGYGFIKTVGEDWRFPFANVISWFEGDDYTFVNLEGALCDGGNPVPKKHNFRGPTAYVNILTENSVEAVTLANNHSMDYGTKGYDSTVATLEVAGVSYAQENASSVFTTESGLTVGVYGAAYHSLDMEDMVAEISAMKEQGIDVIIYAPHWGVEGYYYPSDLQRTFGYAAIDAGAHIVWGSHPHVLQPVEEYNGGIICYSLGNFSFGGNIYPDDYDTALIQQEIIRGEDGTIRLGKTTAVPCCVSSVAGRNNFQPTPYPENSEEYNRVMKKLGLAE